MKAGNLKNAFLVSTICLVMAIWAPVALSQAPTPQPVVKITNGEWPPYLGQHLPNHGTVSDLITRAFARIGYRVEYGFFPWTRSLIMVERKEWDATAVWRRTAEREAKFHFSDPVMTQRYAMFYRKDSPAKFDSLDDLNGKYVGVARSYDYGQEVKRKRDGKEFIALETETDLQLLRNLLLKRLDVALLHRDVGQYIMKTELTGAERDELAISEFSFEEFSLHLLFAKTPEGLALTKKFNAGLRQLGKVK